MDQYKIAKNVNMRAKKKNTVLVVLIEAADVVVIIEDVGEEEDIEAVEVIKIWKENPIDKAILKESIA